MPKILDAAWYTLKSEILLIEANAILEDLEERLRNTPKPSEEFNWSFT